MKNKYINNNIYYKILFISITLPILSVIPYSEYLPNITELSWIIIFYIIYTLYKIKKNTYENEVSEKIWLLNYYIYYNLLMIISGLFITKLNYWDLKSLIINSFGLVMPLASYLGASKKLLSVLIKYYLKYTLIIFILLAPFISRDSYGFYFGLVPFLILLLPYFSRKISILLVLISIFCILADIGARSIGIKFSVPIILTLYYLFHRFIPLKALELLRLLLMALPLVLFILGSTDTFNVFNISEYTTGDYTISNANKEDISSDTRTLIYLEVLDNAEKYNSYLLGQTPGRGTETTLFADIQNITGKAERSAYEVATLNIFAWTGILGLIFYFAIFYFASWLAVNKSNNSFCKIIGIFIAFRWVYSWAEDVNIFNENYFSIWIMIGICYSVSFRKMNNNDIRKWTRDILNNTSKNK